MNESQAIEIAELSRRIDGHRGEVVLRDLDSGYVSQFWLVPMSAVELEQWWRSQDSFDSNPDGVWDALYIACGETPPPHRVFDIPGTFWNADSDESLALWTAMADTHKHYYCELCCDEDSYLRRPDGSVIHHGGFRQSRNA